MHAIARFWLYVVRMYIYNKDSLAHDHQRCFDILLLLFHFLHHFEHGVNWWMTILRPGQEVEQGHLMSWSNALKEIIMLVIFSRYFHCGHRGSSAHPVPFSNVQNSHLPVRFVNSHSKRYYKAAILCGINWLIWPELRAHDLMGHERDHTQHGMWATCAGNHIITTMKLIWYSHL